jgi:hypothetical protein
MTNIQNSLINNSHDPSVLANLNADAIRNMGESDTKTVVKPGFLASFSKFVTKIISDTKGWIMSSIEETESIPDSKYLQNILIKAWKRPEKVRKFCSELEQILTNTETMEKSLVIIKSLLLIHGYMRKGPAESFLTTISIYKGDKVSRASNVGYMQYILANINTV